MGTTRESFLNLDRPLRWPGEEDDYRSDVKVGDIVRGDYGALGEVIGFNNTWSHLTGGRLVHVRPLVAHPGDPVPEHAVPYGHKVFWENNLTPAQPGDIGAHYLRDGSHIGRHVSATWQR